MEFILFLIGGRVYTWMELIFRGYTHWTMFILGGLCFLIIGLLNERTFSWELPFWKQCICGASIVTLFEFVTGLVLNVWLKLNIWDYSQLPFNLLGQICLPFFGIWILISAFAIVLDDWCRYAIYKISILFYPNMELREKPHYVWR